MVCAVRYGAHCGGQQSTVLAGWGMVTMVLVGEVRTSYLVSGGIPTLGVSPGAELAKAHRSLFLTQRPHLPLRLAPHWLERRNHTEKQTAQDRPRAAPSRNSHYIKEYGSLLPCARNPPSSSCYLAPPKKSPTLTGQTCRRYLADRISLTFLDCRSRLFTQSPATFH
jgi:hypothetical protein